MDWRLQEWQKVYASVKDYQQTVLTFSYDNVSAERGELVNILNGDMFFDMKLWPAWTKRLFWKKPLTDEESFKLLCFFIGNGCPPLVIAKWILTSQFWQPQGILKSKVEKRTMQMNNFFIQLANREHEWFYFDMYLNLYLYMNGDKRTKKFHS
jgi:hypothetical protein